MDAGVLGKQPGRGLPGDPGLLGDARCAHSAQRRAVALVRAERGQHVLPRPLSVRGSMGGDRLGDLLRLLPLRLRAPAAYPAAHDRRPPGEHAGVPPHGRSAEHRARPRAGSRPRRPGVFCGYYAIFVALMVGFAVLVSVTLDRRWWDRAYPRAVGTAAAMAMMLALPMLLVYAQVQQTTGFGRSLGNAYAYSANTRDYLASPAYAHAWLLQLIQRWREALFPGYVATIFGVAALVGGLRSRGRARLLWAIYGGFAVLAFWTSLGPSAGLYRVMYAMLPG